MFRAHLPLLPRYRRPLRVRDTASLVAAAAAAVMAVLLGARDRFPLLGILRKKTKPDHHCKYSYLLGLSMPSAPPFTPADHKSAPLGGCRGDGCSSDYHCKYSYFTSAPPFTPAGHNSAPFGDSLALKSVSISIHFACSNPSYFINPSTPPSQLNPFRTAVPFWGHTTQNLSGLCPRRDRSPI